MEISAATAYDSVSTNKESLFPEIPAATEIASAPRGMRYAPLMAFTTHEILESLAEATRQPERPLDRDSDMYLTRGHRIGWGPADTVAWDDVPDLGRVPDTWLAERIGVDVSTVRAARQGRGLPPARVRRRVPSRIGWDEQPLGELSDCALARRLGVDPSTVLHARRQRGIAAYRRQTKPISP